MEDVAKVKIAFRSHMTEAEAREFAFGENFYTGFVVPHLGLDPKDDTYRLDCGEISVSQELFDFWSKLFVEKHKDNPQARAEFNMAWLMSGPTVDEALQGLEVCASDKFIIRKDKYRPVGCSECPHFYECDNVGGFNDCKVAKEDK